MKHDVSNYVRESKGKYLLVNSMARRMRDLQSGYKALVPVAGRTLEEVAIEEFKQGKINVHTLGDE